MRTAEAPPRSMRASALDGFGGPEKLVPRLLPVPAYGADEVLVRVHTAGVGIWDVKARRGEWATGKEHFPIVLGADGSGTVVAVGADVQGLAPGDQVYGYRWRRSKSGFYAEYVTLGAEHVAPIPASLGLRDAGAIAVSGLTALAGIDDALALREGETVLVYGATGGVGSVAVQLAQRRGAHVIATARGADGVAFLRRLGIADAIDGQHGELNVALREAAPEGIDAVLALAGGAGIGPALDALRSGGRVAYPNGVTLPTRDGNSARAFDGVPSRAAFARLSATIDAGPFEVPIGALFALDEAADAHRLLERGHVLGKVVLAVDELEEEIEKVA